MSFCTSRGPSPDLVHEGRPCGKALKIIGYTAKRHLPVMVCARCDKADKDA